MDFFMQELGVPGSQLLLAAEQTLYMVFLSLFIGTVLGLVIAVTLVVTNPNGIVKNSIVYSITNTIVNIVRSVPFIILMVFILPLTKMIVGTRVGTTAAIVPLVIFIAPYLARLFENSILEVNKGIIEAAQSMGASHFEVIWHFLLPEAKGSLILSITTGTVAWFRFVRVLSTPSPPWSVTHCWWTPCALLSRSFALFVYYMHLLGY